MRQHKHAGLSALSARKLSEKNSLKNEHGFSLLEIMITTAIGMIVSAGVATVFVFSMQQMHLLIEKNETEQTSQQISFYLQRYFGQAMNVQAVLNVSGAPTSCGCPGAPGSAAHVNCVKGTATPQPAWAAPGCVDADEGEGQLDFNFDLHGNGNDTADAKSTVANPANSGLGRYYRMAIFNRETASPSGSAPPALGSILWPSAIFFRDPNLSVAGEADPVNLSYNIFFTTSSTPVGMTALLPSRGDLWFSRIHNFRVQPITNCDSYASPGVNGYAIEVVDQNPLDATRNGILRSCLPVNWTPEANTKYWVKTVTFEVTVRYFKSISRTGWDYFFDGGTKWPGTTYPDVANPNMSGSYRDVTQTVKVNFRNNTLTTQSLTGGPGDEERVNGSLYFYNSYVPMSEVNW